MMDWIVCYFNLWEKVDSINCKATSNSTTALVYYSVPAIYITLTTTAQSSTGIGKFGLGKLHWDGIGRSMGTYYQHTSLYQNCYYLRGSRSLLVKSSHVCVLFLEDSCVCPVALFQVSAFSLNSLQSCSSFTYPLYMLGVGREGKPKKTNSLSQEGKLPLLSESLHVH